jgi:hypothetical protein
MYGSQTFRSCSNITRLTMPAACMELVFRTGKGTKEGRQMSCIKFGGKARAHLKLSDH